MRPRRIYFYESKRLQKHAVTMDCMVTVVWTEAGVDRYRCRAVGHDVYGFDKQKDAKAFEIAETRGRISDEKEWLKKLGTKP